MLGHYSRELKLLDLETAIHRITGLTVENFGLCDRGRLQPGMAADITVFDEGRSTDRVAGVNYLVRPATTILAGGGGERFR